jgi:phage anti-repressor protein
MRMNKEKYNQIIDEAYKNYVNKTNEDFIKSDITLPPSYYPMDKEEFINKCKTDTEFSQKWGLKIEERELSLEERLRLVNYDKQKFSSIDEWIKWYENEPNEFYYLGINYTKDTALTDLDVPTKLITITYNDKIIESYE